MYVKNNTTQRVDYKQLLNDVDHNKKENKRNGK